MIVPKTRMAYRHISGEVFVVAGNATHLKTGEAITIISSLRDATIRVIETERFFDKHPTTGEERFTLVTPKNSNI
jgi:hypothetical protein